MKIDKSRWRKVKFGEVVTYKKVTVDPENSGLERYIAGDHMNTEDLHLRKWGTIGEGYLGPAFHSKFEKGDILYGSRRTYLKKVAVADFDGVTSNTTFVLKENTELVVPGFVPFLMLSDSFTQHSVKNSKGSVNPYINFKDIAKYEFLLPPLEEQARLSELLWAGDEVLGNYHLLNSSVSSLKNFYNNSLLRGLINVESLLPELDLVETPIGLVFRKFEIVQFGSVVNIIHGYQFRDFDFADEGVPIVKISQIDHFGNLDISKASFISSSRIRDFEDKIISNGDVLMALTGATLGKTCLVTNLKSPVLQNYRVGRFEPIENKIDKMFMYYLMTSEIALKQVFSSVNFGAQGNVGKGDFEKILIPLPPLSVQKKIARLYGKVDSNKKITDDSRLLLTQLNKQLINQIFNHA